MTVAYTIKTAAAASGMSEDIVRKAIHATDAKAFPPPLAAKRAGAGGKYLIPARELEDWISRFPDA